MEYGISDYSSEYGSCPGRQRDPEQEKRTARQIRRCFSRVGLIYLLYLILSNGCQLVVGYALVWTGLAAGMNMNLYMLITTFSMYPVAVPLTALLMRLVPSMGDTGKESWGIGKLGGFFVFSLGVLYLGNLTGMALMGLAGLVKGEPIVNGMQELMMSLESWTILLAAVLTAPVMEELVFRKFLLDRIAGYGHWTAMIVSGLIFAMAHGNFYQFFYAFGLGMIFAYVYLHTGKIRYTIGFHMLINFMGSIVPMAIIELEKVNPMAGRLLLTGNLMMMFGYVICGGVLLICCHRELSFHPGYTEISAGRKNRAVWLNMGMILFLLSGGALLALSL